MNAQPELWPLEGVAVDDASLRLEKAMRLVELLRASGDEVFAHLHEVRRREGDGAEIIVFKVNVERPQKLAHDVQREEWLQAVFQNDSDKAPEVWILRKSFPLVPHTMLTPSGLPRQACLYEQGWDEVRLNWNAAQFLMRIRHWLARTATGTLHAEDQPLEPLIMPSRTRLILPADFSLTSAKDHKGLLNIGRLPKSGKDTVLAAEWKEQGQPMATHSAAAIFECQPQQHGVIQHQPQNLYELNELCLKAGLDLVKELTAKVQEWHRDKPDPKILQAQLIIIILLPKTRRGTVIEGIDTCAFLTGRTVQEVGQSMGAIGKEGGQIGYIIGEIKASDDEVKSVPIMTIQVHNALSPASAATLNGQKLDTQKVVAVGMGALGSQVFNNMVRAGFGNWTLIDGDVLLPHNCARHFLGNWAVGQSKAESMAIVANAVLDGPEVAKALHTDLLHPDDKRSDLEAAMNAADIVMDFSASVAVSRHIGGAETKARALSAFLTPTGDSLVVAIEDKERLVRLDWLEMLHYRAVLNTPQLMKTLSSENANFRYGNACRDLSSRIPQDDVALWAALCSKRIKALVAQPSAGVEIFLNTKDGGVEVLKEEVSPVVTATVGKWEIRFDQNFLAKLSRYRESKLPNETGGVLVGHFDTHHHICSIVDMVPSPPDSVEWPISYIRGCEGLNEKILEVGRLTLGQMHYVGEWHSHPDGCSTSPSSDDMQAYAWLVGHMCKEDLPAIMMIVGQDNSFRFVASSQ